MFPLGLSPLPVSRPEVEVPESASWDDFVSAEVLREVAAGACSGRLPVSPLDLGLSSNDDDFAAMAVEAAPRMFVPMSWPQVNAEEAFTRRIFTPAFDPVASRATPPAVPKVPLWDAAEAAAASRKGYRWWIPGLLGVAATFVLSAVLFLSAQQTHGPETADLHGIRWGRAPEPRLQSQQTAAPSAKDKEAAVAAADRLDP